MYVRAFIEEMERLAPPECAEEFDNGRIGLIIDGKKEIATICCALDATPAVVKEAVAARAEILVVHHTPLWTPVTSLTGPTAALMREVLGAGLNVYVMHTNFDHAEAGVNDALAELLGLKETAPMTLGLVGDCSLSLKEIARRLDCPLRVWGKVSQPKRLAVVGGSGFDPIFLDEAQALGAEAFLSAELKHSVYRSAPLPCIEATHYALEAPAMRRLAAQKGWQYIEDAPLLHTVP
jgi:dinuclear metal center YbgI/SA1388 family protein